MNFSKKQIAIIKAFAKQEGTIVLSQKGSTAPETLVLGFNEGIRLWPNGNASGLDTGAETWEIAQGKLIIHFS